LAADNRIAADNQCGMMWDLFLKYQSLQHTVTHTNTVDSKHTLLQPTHNHSPHCQEPHLTYAHTTAETTTATAQ
jgi:hypothetical protein